MQRNLSAPAHLWGFCALHVALLTFHVGRGAFSTSLFLFYLSALATGAAVGVYIGTKAEREAHLTKRLLDGVEPNLATGACDDCAVVDGIRHQLLEALALLPSQVVQPASDAPHGHSGREQQTSPSEPRPQRDAREDRGEGDSERTNSCDRAEGGEGERPSRLH